MKARNKDKLDWNLPGQFDYYCTCCLCHKILEDTDK
jgi:hypothetical protein